MLGTGRQAESESDADSSQDAAALVANAQTRQGPDCSAEEEEERDRTPQGQKRCSVRSPVSRAGNGGVARHRVVGRWIRIRKM
eukprot:729760-Rhodomonas_salina.1